MDLLENITNFVANVIERVYRQAVFWRLGGEMVLWGL